NATKFTPDRGKIAISAMIEPAAQTGADPSLVLRVSDSGMGISPELMPTLFELFTQGQLSVPGRPSGLGIGLALTRRLVELHGGTILAKSEGSGKGSEFTVRIPAPACGEPGRNEESVSTGTLAGVRVMIVDDDRDAGDSTDMLISQMGGEVRTFYDGV